MSAKPSPEEPNASPETATDVEKPEAAAVGDNQPQPGAGTTAQPSEGVAAESEKAAAGDRMAAEARAAELESQVKDLTDRLLRAHAEMDNIRKRAEREKADMAKYAITKFAGDIVVLADNFERAVSAVPPGAAEQDATLNALIEGVTMMEREFLNVLERHGVKRIDPKDQPFNPHLHDAVMEQQNPEVPNGTVVQVFQPGYTIEDRVLRPAMVVVAKGGPKQQPPQKTAAAQAEEPAPQAEQPHGSNGGSDSVPPESENGAGAS